MFYAVSISRVIFTAKTSLDLFSHGREQVWTYSVLDENRFGLIQSWVIESMRGAVTVSIRGVAYFGLFKIDRNTNKNRDMGHYHLPLIKYDRRHWRAPIKGPRVLEIWDSGRCRIVSCRIRK